MFGMFGVWLKSHRTNLLQDENRSKLNSAHPHPSCLVLSVLRLPKVFCVERKNWSQWEKMWLIQLPLHGFLGISNLPIKKICLFFKKYLLPDLKATIGAEIKEDMETTIQRVRLKRKILNEDDEN